MREALKNNKIIQLYFLLFCLCTSTSSQSGKRRNSHCKNIMKSEFLCEVNQQKGKSHQNKTDPKSYMGHWPKTPTKQSFFKLLSNLPLQKPYFSVRKADMRLSLGRVREILLPCFAVRHTTPKGR